MNTESTSSRAELVLDVLMRCGVVWALYYLAGLICRAVG